MIGFHLAFNRSRASMGQFLRAWAEKLETADMLPAALVRHVEADALAWFRGEETTPGVQVLLEWHDIGGDGAALLGVAIARSDLKMAEWDPLLRQVFALDSRGEHDCLDAMSCYMRDRLDNLFLCGDCLYVEEKTSAYTKEWRAVFEDHADPPARCPECGNVDYWPSGEPESRGVALAARGLRTTAERIAACRRLHVMLREGCDDAAKPKAEPPAPAQAMDPGHPVTCMRSCCTLEEG